MRRKISRRLSAVRRTIHKIGGDVRRRRVQCAVGLLAQVSESEPGHYTATGNDAQLVLALDEAPHWASLVIEIEAPEAAPFARARLYVDRGSGFNERDSYDLGPVNVEQRTYIYLGPESRQIRLDPIDEESDFRIAKLEIRRVTAAEVRLSAFVSRLRRQNAAQPTETMPAAMQMLKALDQYEAWLEVNEWNARRAEALSSRLKKINCPARFSIMLPVYNASAEFLDLALRSVANQVYDNWELCIAACSDIAPEIDKKIEISATNDTRINLTLEQEKCEVGALFNAAAEKAAGVYLVFLGPNDELSPDALAEVAGYLDEHSATDVLYSDEDEIDASGHRHSPRFKPDWSPELLLSYMYAGNLLAVRNDLFRSIDGFRTGLEGYWKYDLLLRATEAEARVGHVPKVLYHHRDGTAGTGLSGIMHPSRSEPDRKVIKQAFCRRGVRAEVVQQGWAKHAGLAIFSHVFPDEGPRVSILIPTKNNPEMLRRCIDSLKKTTYRNYEVVVIDNEGDSPEAIACLKNLPHRVLRIGNPDGRFNFAHLNNEAAKQVDGDYLLFLNDDTEVVTPRWLSQMVGYLEIEGVGAVGARLVYPNGRIQHAGVVHGFFDGAVGHAFKLLPARDPGYLAFAAVVRNYSAVTAACMLTSRSLFLRLGGFDEKAFAVAFNDVDYCYRLRAAGKRIVYCPTAELIHHEGTSRERVDDPIEVAAFRRKYGEFADPYYNPNLKLVHERFEVDSKTLPVSGMKAVKVLICTPHMNRQGASLALLEMTIGLKVKGIIDPIVCSPEDGSLRDEYEKEGIRVMVFPLAIGDLLSEPEEYNGAVEELAGVVRESGVELVYANTGLMSTAIEAAAYCRLPSIWNIRESYLLPHTFGPDDKRVFRRVVSCLTYPYRVVFNANATLSTYRPLGTHHNFINLYDGLDRARFLSRLKERAREESRQRLALSDSEVAILTVGTPCERKGQLDIAGTLARFGSATADRIRWYIVGDRPGEYSSRLHRALDRLPRKARSQIEIIEEMPDVFTYYSAADLYVCTSRSESFPRVILEAMAAGLPIITTPVDGIVEQVKEGFNALFYQPGDVKTLARQIEKLVNDDELRKSMGSKSPVMLDTIIDYETMLEKYGQVFQEAWLSGKPRVISDLGERARVPGIAGDK